MFAPLAHAHPAKVVSTLASHVITTLVLFDWLLATWAGLGVGDHPCCVL